MSTSLDTSRTLTVLDAFYHWEGRKPDAVFLRQPAGGQWTDITWAQAGDTARRVAAWLGTRGLPRGSRIAILASNCAEWLIADLAIAMAEHVSAPIFVSMHGGDVEYILDHADVEIAFLGQGAVAEHVEACKGKKVPIVRMPRGPECVGEARWEDLVAETAPLDRDPRPDPDTLYTIIYTSGSTGRPKGVVHSHRTLADGTGKNSALMVGATGEDRLFSYLPLAHGAERALVWLMGLYGGAVISFNESLATFAEDLRIARPTIFFSVPRLWAKFREGICAKFGESKLNELLDSHETAEATAAQVRAALGLGDTKLCLVGSAPTSADLHAWFERIGLSLHEVYGQSEVLAGTFNPPGAVRPGTVGKEMPHAEIRIADSGEILIRSEAIMVGYHNDREKTDETLIDGWIHTGDRGEVDEDGYLRITGRVKELFKTTKGKYIAPVPIEAEYAELTTIEQTCLIGSGMDQPILLVALSDLGREEDKEALTGVLRERTEDLNNRLAAHQRIGKVLVTPTAWTQENGLLTHTLKLKRSAIEDRFAGQAASLATREGDLVVWIQGAG